MLTAFKFKVKQLERQISGERTNGPTHAWGYVDSSAGNSSWATDEHDIF
ncbi:MAG: hypothetical protein AAF773_11715 [Cyanobacteria bacterium P01_D01_bin.115]